MNIVDIAAGSDDFNILVAALNAAGLTDTVRNADDITVFAPTDAAFTALAVDLGFDGDQSDETAVTNFIVQTLETIDPNDDLVPLLNEVLLYHVAPGARTEPTILGSDGIATLFDGAEITPADGKLGDLEPDLEDPTIVAPDIMADNGIIQGIDRVLLPIDIEGNTKEEVPPQNIVDIAAGSDDFNILVTALNTAGLTDTVRDADDITVFAPTDAAFTALAVDLGFDGDQSDEDAVFAHIAGALTDLAADNDPIPLLTDILLYHVSGGAKSVEDVFDADGISTLLTDAEITPAGGALVDGEPDLLDPVIIAPDVAASNGIIQGISKVLLPIDIPGNDRDTIAEIVAASDGVFDDNDGDFDVLLNALTATGLDDALNNPDSNLTVFAPNDQAFISAAQSLGYEGSDEAGAFTYIVQAATLLSRGGDPIPLLSDILLYHVAPGALDATAVLGSDTIPTLLGVDLGVDGTSLVDQEPDVSDPNIIDTDILASNGIVHVIDGVLVPLDVLPPNGEAASALLIGTEIDEILTLGAGDDFADGGGGDDLLIGGAGDDVLLGGDGIDDAEVSGSFDDYGLVFSPDGIEITDKGNDVDGTDFLKDIEFVQFDNGRLNLTVLDGAVDVSADDLRLLTETYVAYFDRAPDAGGLLFWATSLANGVSLAEIAELFFEQPETQEKMPADLTAPAFVDLAYQNFLERAPDEAGKTFWVSNLEAGNVSRPEFMLALIEGARADTGSPDDVRTIEDKGDIGVSFALINGLNNVAAAEEVMAAYDDDDRDGGLAKAQMLIAETVADVNGADGTTEFTFQLAGVIDDPFAIA